MSTELVEAATLMEGHNNTIKTHQALGNFQVSRPIYSEMNFAERFPNQSNYNSSRHKRTFSEKAKNFFSVAFRTISWHQYRKNWFYKRIPILKWLPKYSFKNDGFADACGGLTVGVMQIPQGLAFAMLASLPPVTGLYTALLPVFIYMVMGTSRYLSKGSFPVVCIMVAQVVEREILKINGTATPLQRSNETNTFIHTTQSSSWSPLDAKKLEIAISLALLIGLIQIAMGLFRLGFTASYLSDPVVSGFTTGSAVVIVLSQVQHIIGLNSPHFTGIFSVAKSTAFLFTNITRCNAGSIITGTLSIAALIAVKHLNERYKRKLPCPIPGELLVVILSSGISYAGKINSRFGVQIIEDIPKGFPPLSIPSLALMNYIYPDAFKIGIVIFASNISMAKLYAKKNGQTIDTNQELIAYGACNVGVGFLSGFPVCSALSRVVVQANIARTQLCSVYVIAIVLLVLMFIAHLFYYLPMAVLSAIVISNLTGLLQQFAIIKQLWIVSRPDAIIWCLTCFGVVFLGIDIGLGCGVLSALLAVTLVSTRTRYSILGRISDTDIYRDVKNNPEAKEIYGIKIIRFESPLYYVNAENFKNTLHSIIKTAGPSTHHENFEEVIDKSRLHYSSKTQNECHIEEQNAFVDGIQEGSICTISSIINFVIIDAATFTYIDSMGIETLRSVQQEFTKLGIDMYLANCTTHIQKQFIRSGFLNTNQTDVMFVSIHDAVLYCSQMISQQLKETRL